MARDRREPTGRPVAVRVHDFIDPLLGKAIPYGSYDLGRNVGWVTVGQDHDTARFAVQSLRRWWHGDGAIGRKPGCARREPRTVSPRERQSRPSPEVMAAFLVAAAGPLGARSPHGSHRSADPCIRRPNSRSRS